jgi:hypothetical protein
VTDVPSFPTPTQKALDDECARLVGEHAPRALADAKLLDAHEALYDLIKELPTDTDSEAAVYRCIRRRFEEAVGERFTRLLKERPEGQKLFALRWDEVKQERDDAQARLAQARDLLLTIWPSGPECEHRVARRIFNVLDLSKPIEQDPPQ